MFDELGFDLPVNPEDYENPDDLPCYRQIDQVDGEWSCMFDHTGCLYNNGNNICSAEGETSYPLGWVCPECGETNEPKRLFCINNQHPDGRTDESCTGKHPEYWEMTKDWPVRHKRPRKGIYY